MPEELCPTCEFNYTASVTQKDLAHSIACVVFGGTTLKTECKHYKPIEHTPIKKG